MPLLSPRFGSRNQDPGSAFWNGQGRTHSLRPASKCLRLKDALRTLSGGGAHLRLRVSLFVFDGLPCRLSKIGSRMAQLMGLPCACWLPRGTFACWCAAVFLEQSASHGISGACALGCSLQQGLFSWDPRTAR